MRHESVLREEAGRTLCFDLSLCRCLLAAVAIPHVTGVFRAVADVIVFRVVSSGRNLPLAKVEERDRCLLPGEVMAVLVRQCGERWRASGLGRVEWEAWWERGLKSEYRSTKRSI